MRTITKKILSVLLVLCFTVTVLLSAVVSVAKAADSAAAPKRFNIMMVIDGSGSLETDDKTDPDRMRYELISDLLGVLEDDGHNIGAIVFSGNKTTDTSEAAMQSGILLNTGMLSLDSASPDGRPVKDYVYDRVVDTGYDKSRKGTTDVGTAVLVAERILQEKQKENGLESLVFLFTDGNTDMHTLAQEEISAKNMATATSEMQASGIRLMGAFLNKGGKLSSSEIKGVVCAANGITETSKEFSYSYVEIHDASSAHEAVNAILKFLGYIDGPTPDPITDNLHVEFVIPGIGVEEMNIRLYSVNGATLPSLDVKLTQPDGTVLQGADLKAMGRISRTFHVYKLVDPAPGKWVLDVVVPAGNKIAYIYNPVYSLHIDAAMNVTPDASEWHVNKNVTFAGSLVQNGAAVTDPASYREYACSLVITNLVDGTAETIDIPNDSSGKFEKTLTLDKYGQFKAQMVFSCDKLSVEANTVEYLLENEAPTTNGTVKQKLTYGLFQENTYSLDLSQYFNDREDGKNLTLQLQNASCAADAYTLNGAALELKNAKLKNDTMEFTVQDTQGAAATLKLEITSRSVTAGLVTLIIVILAILAVIAIVIIIVLNSIKPKGELAVSFEVELGGRTESVHMYLHVPNVNAPSSTNLKKLLTEALNDDALRLDGGLDPENVKVALRSAMADLDEVAVRSTIKQKKKKLTGAILVKKGKTKKVLFDSSITVVVGGIDFTLEFITEKDDDFDPFSSNDSYGSSDNNNENDPFADMFS